MALCCKHMEKLASLQTSPWKLIEEQANHIHEVISRYQKDGMTKVSISGKLHKVNKVILNTNGFNVTDGLLDYQTGKPYFMVSWDLDKFI